jgi:hypothetical protein
MIISTIRTIITYKGITHNTYKTAGGINKRRDGTINNLKELSFPASLLLFIPPAVLYVLCVIPLYVMIVLIVEMIIIGWMHNYLHDSFHIKNHFLSRMPLIKKIFDKWSHDHYLHHEDMTKNFGIFFFVWDRVFGTYLK